MTNSGGSCARHILHPPTICNQLTYNQNNGHDRTTNRLTQAGRGTLPNVKCAGDWVRMGEREHGAKGLCQERAYVSGLEAANALLDDMDAPAAASSSSDDKSGKKHAVLPVRADEPQVQAGYQVSRALFGSGGNGRRFWVR